MLKHKYSLSRLKLHLNQGQHFQRGGTNFEMFGYFDHLFTKTMKPPGYLFHFSLREILNYFNKNYSNWEEYGEQMEERGGGIHGCENLI